MKWFFGIVIATASLGYIHDTAFANSRFALRQTAAVPELAVVLQRAAEYVTQYEAELGNLIGTEEYLQTVNWPNTPGHCDLFKPCVRGKSMTRLTSSDFMLIQVGGQWAELRQVKEVDGMKLKNDEPPLDSAFDDSPENNTRRLERMKAESTKYNFGDILREINLPTFALQVLRKEQVSRFAFERAGSEKINGVMTWHIRFREMNGAALVVNEKGGQALYSSGALWIEPDTGRVLKTEFHVDDPFADPEISCNVIVTYAEDKTLHILIPETMVEHDETVNNIIDSRAAYSHFQRYTVDIKFETAPPKP